MNSVLPNNAGEKTNEASLPSVERVESDAAAAEKICESGHSSSSKLTDAKKSADKCKSASSKKSGSKSPRKRSKDSKKKQSSNKETDVEVIAIF